MAPPLTRAERLAERERILLAYERGYLPLDSALARLGYDTPQPAPPPTSRPHPKVGANVWTRTRKRRVRR